MSAAAQPTAVSVSGTGTGAATLSPDTALQLQPEQSFSSVDSRTSVNSASSDVTGNANASALLNARHATFATLPYSTSRHRHEDSDPTAEEHRGRSLSRSSRLSNGTSPRPQSLSDVVRLVIERMRSQKNFLSANEEYPVVPETRPPSTSPPPPGAALPSARPLLPQEQSSAYKIAYMDLDFLESDEMRPVRLQIEHQKVTSILDKQGIESTIVVFGSARIRPLQALLQQIAELEGKITVGDDPDAPLKLAQVKKLIPLTRYYDEARAFARIVAQHSDGKRLVVMTGGGPGIMEAANRGAHDAGADSIGLNITLPHEQHPNPYVTPELCFSFHYFSMRKMHFLTRAKALVACPGGFGTFVSFLYFSFGSLASLPFLFPRNLTHNSVCFPSLPKDELFECLTLVQTGKMSPIPIVLLGKAWWSACVNLPFLAEHGMISPQDLELFKMVDTAQEAWDHICGFYAGDVAHLKRRG